MIDYKMVVNIALGIVLGMVVVGLGGMLMHKVGGKDRMMYGKEKKMMMEGASDIEVQVDAQ